ncbi:hypothetical protein KM043_011969 [Ampulex compressa]|nr:hypothetical protein KM043_011969 [Ampulex compressa]
MSKLKEEDDKEALKLDQCFKETLIRVRPYIVQLTSPEEAQLCKLWIDKLNYASSQRTLRNEYLLELCRELKSGHIGGIFSEPPQNGLLVPLPKAYHMAHASSSLSELSDSCTSPPSERSVKHNQKKYPRNKAALGRTRVALNARQHARTMEFSPAPHFYEKDMIPKNHPHGIVELQTHNEDFKLLRHQRNNRSNGRLYIDIKQLTAEAALLRTRLMETEERNSILEINHKRLIQYYNNTIVDQVDKLKHQLYEAQKKNEILDSNVAAMCEKLEEIIHGKEEEVKIIEKRWMEKLKAACQKNDALMEEKDKELQFRQEMIDKKELELVQKEDERQQEIETLMSKIQDLETKLETKIKDEDKLQNLLTEQHTTMKEEFNKMRNEIDSANKKQNQSLIAKIAVLKKSVLKLERSKDKLSHDYEKRILHILKNKDYEVKMLQLRLEEQRSELCKSFSTEKQCEIDNLVDSLEERYRSLFAAANATAENQRQEYIRKINVLENELFKLKKSFEDG